MPEIGIKLSEPKTNSDDTYTNTIINEQKAHPILAAYRRLVLDAKDTHRGLHRFCHFIKSNIYIMDANAEDNELLQFVDTNILPSIGSSDAGKRSIGELPNDFIQSVWMGVYKIIKDDLSYKDYDWNNVKMYERSLRNLKKNNTRNAQFPATSEKEEQPTSQHPDYVYKVLNANKTWNSYDENKPKSSYNKKNSVLKSPHTNVKLSSTMTKNSVMKSPAGAPIRKSSYAPSMNENKASFTPSVVGKKASIMQRKPSMNYESIVAARDAAIAQSSSSGGGGERKPSFSPSQYGRRASPTASVHSCLNEYPYKAMTQRQQRNNNFNRPVNPHYGNRKDRVLKSINNSVGILQALLKHNNKTGGRKYDNTFLGKKNPPFGRRNRILDWYLNEERSSSL